MKNLTTTLCLTIAVLLGSVGVSWGAEKRIELSCQHVMTYFPRTHTSKKGTSHKLAFTIFPDSKIITGGSKSKYSSWASGVPGTVYGLGLAHEKYGSMPWDILIYPSVNLAKYGFKLDYHNVKILNSERYRNFFSLDQVYGIFLNQSHLTQHQALPAVPQ